MIVLDASAAMGIALNTDVGAALRGLILKDESVVAPDLFKSEVANAFWKYVHAGHMERSEAQRLLGLTCGLVDTYHRMSDFAVEAFRASLQFDHPVYDMYYLVLARHTGSTLVTLDRRLIEACEAAQVDCVHEVEI